MKPFTYSTFIVVILIIIGNNSCAVESVNPISTLIGCREYVALNDQRVICLSNIQRKLGAGRVGTISLVELSVSPTDTKANKPTEIWTKNYNLIGQNIDVSYYLISDIVTHLLYFVEITTLPIDYPVYSFNMYKIIREQSGALSLDTKPVVVAPLSTHGVASVACGYDAIMPTMSGGKLFIQANPISKYPTCRPLYLAYESTNKQWNNYVYDEKPLAGVEHLFAEPKSIKVR